MTSYIVSWKIDMDADDPVAAAEFAQFMLREDPGDWIYEVTDPDGNVTEVDLEYEHLPGDEEHGN